MLNQETPVTTTLHAATLSSTLIAQDGKCRLTNLQIPAVLECLVWLSKEDSLYRLRVVLTHGPKVPYHTDLLWVNQHQNAIFTEVSCLMALRLSM